MHLRPSPHQIIDSSGDISGLSRWGGLFAASVSTDDFETVRRDDPDIRQMVDFVLRPTVQCYSGLRVQRSSEPGGCFFVAHRLTPAIINRWNSPVLNGLWQTVTGRTPDGVTPGALNPPLQHRGIASAIGLASRVSGRG